MLWGVWLLLPVSLLADSHQLESFLCDEASKSGRSQPIAHSEVAEPGKIPESRASVAYRSQPADISWKKGAQRVHPLDRLLLDADRSRQEIEDQINVYVKKVFPRNVSAELAPGSGEVHLLMVISF